METPVLQLILNPRKPIASQHLPALPPSFFARPAEVVAPELIGCLLVKRQEDGALLWGVIVETEAYCQSEPACHGHRRRSPSNETLFAQPGHFYVYVSYGIHHCVNVVTGRADWANGVLLRAIALPGEAERIAAGPALLARRFGIDRRHDHQPVDANSGLWLAPRPAALQQLLSPAPVVQAPEDQAPAAAAASDTALRDGLVSDPAAADCMDRPHPMLLQTHRIGISQGQDLPWRWYLRASRSVSRRAPGDRTPRPTDAWRPAPGMDATA